MTRITVKTDADGRIAGFVASGHAGASRDGEYDLICSAVSALTTTAVNALEAVGGIKARVEVEDGYLSCFLPGGLDEGQQQRAQIILETILTGLNNIEESYPKWIRIETRNGGKPNA
ncbi:MAG: ribosomal-processing cysteine protease Prp [Clostridia bacterium]|nr:ribosomal-processing cysteine protease Prp [Clostridia bacterium]